MLAYLLLALVCAIVAFFMAQISISQEIKLSLGLAGVVFLGVIFICWWFMPDIGIRFLAWLWFILCAGALGILLSYLKDQDEEELIVKIAVLAIFASIVLLGRWVTTAEVFRYRAYREMLQLVELPEENFQKDFVPTKPDEMIKVDISLAEKYASAVLEQDAAIGSVCELSKFYRQRLLKDIDVTLATGERKTLKLAGEIVYIAPLEHRSFWKWRKRDVTPGFIIVSAQRQNEVYFVTGINGEDLKLRYLHSGYFGDYIFRHIRKAGYANGVTNISVVLSPEGRPMVTATLYKRTIGCSGEKVTGMLTVDIQTGEVEEYDLSNLPEWIDRVYPESFIRKYINDWGEYPEGRGYFNSLFAQVSVRKMTPGIEAVYNGKDRYIYTGIQSAGADDGTSGVMMINSRTGRATLYELQGGANEVSTKEKFEQNYKIDAAEVTASDVIIYPVRGENLYFTTLKGMSGDFLGYGVSSVKYRDLAAVGKSIDEALLNYYVAKKNTSLDTQAIVAALQKTEILIVSAKAFEDGMYYFIFENVKGREYMAPAKMSKELKWTNVGDQVQISYSQTMAEEQTIMLERFENLSFSL